MAEERNQHDAPPFALRSQAVPDFISDEMLTKGDAGTSTDDDVYGDDTPLSKIRDAFRRFTDDVDISMTSASLNVEEAIGACLDWRDDTYLLVSDVLGRQKAASMDYALSNRLSSSWSSFMTILSGTYDDTLAIPTSNLFEDIAGALSDTRHSSVGYPDYAYHETHERPHLAPYGDDWEDKQMLGTVTTFKSALKETKGENGERLYSIKTRGEMSCPWCAWIDDLEYAESILMLASKLIGHDDASILLDAIGDVSQVQDGVKRTWEWLGRHLGDL